MNVIIKVFIILALLIVDGLVAGLVLGILSLDDTKLKILSTTGNKNQKRAAKRIAPVRRKSHLLLVSLLLANTLVNEALPLLLHDIFGDSIISIVVATVLVVIFAEIIPQAVCVHYGLQIGSFFIWFVYLLIGIFFPFSYPISKILDYFLGAHEGALYKKTELKELVGLHATGAGGDLTTDEINILQGTLQLHQKRIEQIMTPLCRTFALDVNTFIDTDLLQKIADSGHSRIPIYVNKKENIIGIMLVKNLILLDHRHKTYVRDLILIKAPRMVTTINLFDALNVFQEGASHMSVIVDSQDVIIGICTLEDIFEDIVNEEIIDETDIYTDNTHTMRIVRKARSERKQTIPKEIHESNFTAAEYLPFVSKESGSGSGTRDSLDSFHVIDFGRTESTLSIKTI